MKIHIILKDDIHQTVKQKKEALADLIDKLGLKNVNKKRAARYGIISGDVDNTDQVKTIKEMEEVQGVEVDSIKEAI